MYIQACIYLMTLLVNSIHSENYSEKVQRYVKIIEEGIAKAYTYNVPEDASQYKVESDQYKDYGSYDYIVVGSGSAGSVVAARLSEDPNKTVLLLEAGGLEDIFVNIPGVALYLQGLDYNWNYKTTPQSNACLGMINQQCAYPRGKGLGGSSLINAMVYARGNKEDYDKWVRMGNLGWSYEDVLPYFKKFEKFTINSDKGYHGTDGVVTVEYHKPSNPQLDAFLEANQELGYKILDYNGKCQIGASKTQFSLIKGVRESTAKVFLYPAISRDNLEILTYSYVTKIRIDNSTKQALGVTFTNNNAQFKVTARKEVILSAGVIGSPQLLMLSGVGPKQHLKSVGIPTIHNLPVGNTFKDHAAFFGLPFVGNYSAPFKTMDELVKQFLDGQGPLTVESSLQGISFYNLGKRNNVSSQPDVEILFQPSNASVPFLEKAYRIEKDVFENFWGKMKPEKTFSMICMLLHPKSRGTLRLKSSDPFEYPLLDAGYLSDKNGEDLELMYKAVQFGIKLANTNAFKKLNASLLDLPVSKCTQKHQYLSKDYWHCCIRHLTMHVFHGSGTCRMGADQRKSVVDHELKVHGIKNLRVVDASIFPTPISGHNNAPVIMVAEKVSDLIKRSSWNLTKCNK